MGGSNALNIFVIFFICIFINFTVFGNVRIFTKNRNSLTGTNISATDTFRERKSSFLNWRNACSFKVIFIYQLVAKCKDRGMKSSRTRQT